jgi:hypothetical protein
MIYLTKLTKTTASFFLKNLLLFFLIYDFVVKIIVHVTNISFFYNYVVVFKLVLISPILLSEKLRKIDLSYLLPVVGLLISYLVTQLFYFNQINNYNLFFNVYYFFSSIIPLLFVFFISKIEYSIIQKQISMLIWFLLISSFFILVGLVFEIDLLRTYFRSSRFGFSGLLLYHHEAGFIYFILLNLLYYKFIKNKTLFNLSLLILIMIISLVVGTKKTMFLTVFFFIYFFIDNIKRLKTLFVVIISAIIGLIIFSNIIDKYFVFFYDIYRKSGFLNSFLSYRDTLLTEKLYPYISQNNSIINLIFGWPFFKSHRSEMELFDATLFFGLVGLISYFLFFKNILLSKNKQTYFMVSSLLIATFISGNLFISINVMMMMYLSILYMNPVIDQKE